MFKRFSQIKTPAALTRFLDRYYNGSLEAFYQELNRESDRLIRTDLKKAGRLTEQTAALEKLLPDQYRAQLYRIWGRHYHLSGNYPRALVLYEKAIDLFAKVKDYNSRARVQKALLDVLAYLGRYTDAAKAGQRSLTYYRRIDAKNDYAQVLTNLGNLYHRLDENKKALRYYDRAYTIFGDLENDFALALVQFNRGNVYSNLNDLEEAERLYRYAAEKYRSLSMELAAAQSDYSLAYIAFLKGSYSESLAAFSQAADVFERLGDKRCRALTELDRTEIYLHLNLYSQTIADASAVAGKFRRLGMAYEEAKAHYFAAAGYFAYGDLAAVDRLARKALDGFTRENNRVWQVLCRFLLAKVDCREGRVAAAVKTFRGIAGLYRRLGNIRQYHDVRLAWLEALVSSQKRRAASALAKGIGRSQHEMAGYQRYIYLTLVGDLYRSTNREEAAVRFYRRAIAEAEKLQTSIFPDEIRRFFWMDKLAAYNRLTGIYLHQGKRREAFRVIEKGKAALFLTSGGAEKRMNDDSIPPALAEERIRLKAYLRKIMTPAGSAARGMAAVSRVRATEQRLWQIERYVHDHGSMQTRADAGVGWRMEEIQARLQPHDRLLQYVFRSEACGVFVVGKEAFRYVPLDADIETVRGLLARFYFLITGVSIRPSDQPIISELVARLSDKLWRPIQGNLEGCQRALIAPDGILTRLPFYVLDSGDGTAVFERYETYLFPSSSAIAERPADSPARKADGRVSIIAVSEPDLPGAAMECAVVARHFTEPDLVIGEAADTACLFDRLEKEGGLVHLAAHAAQSYENHMFSQILLADGPAYSFDLLSRPVRSDLVVLSGCQTGDPGIYYDGDSLSLAQSFLMAGAKNVIASYWPVSDEATCRFMDTFYKHLAHGALYPALRSAMADMKNRTGDIRLWAPFYLTCR